MQNPRGLFAKFWVPSRNVILPAKGLGFTSAAPIRDSAYLEEICSVDVFTSEDFMHHKFPSVLIGKHLEENIDAHISELEGVLGHDLT